MCWNAQVSFSTFAIGTLLNISSYSYLRHMQSSIQNIIIYWQYTLLMQIVEGIAWIQIQNEEDIQIVSKFAMVLNTFQPLILMLVVRFGLLKPIKYAGIANLMYFALLLSDGVWNFTDIKPQDGCTHLRLRYWTTTRTTLYMLASLISFWEIPSLFWSLVNMSIFLISFFIAIIFTSCGVGSLFCWIIFTSGPILVTAFYVRRIKVSIENAKLVFLYTIR